MIAIEIDTIIGVHIETWTDDESASYEAEQMEAFERAVHAMRQAGLRVKYTRMERPEETVLSDALFSE